MWTSLLVALVILGAVLYIISLLPIDATIKRIIHVVAILLVVLYILQAFGFVAPHGKLP
jgi:hypothetical protein